jgi:methylmalonyl-CoA/ethylmalonyl-CoA epimerase
MQLHHLGLAVKNIEKSFAYYSKVFSLVKTSEVFTDPIQQVKVMFMKNPAEEIYYELIEPLDENSPVAKALQKKQSLYHLCYEVASVSETIRHFQANGGLLVSGPDKAVAFELRKIAFIYTPEQLLIEIVEARRNGL